MVLTDQKMPDVTGTELLAELKETHPDIVRILITGYTDIGAAVKAINEGNIYRYIPKTSFSEEIIGLIKQAIEWYHVHKEMRRLQTLVLSFDEAELIELSSDFSLSCIAPERLLYYKSNQCTFVTSATPVVQGKGWLYTKRSSRGETWFTVKVKTKFSKPMTRLATVSVLLRSSLNNLSMSLHKKPQC